MTKEQITFLQILSDHLNGRNTSPVGDVDWETILRCARNHQVTGMVYTQCKAFLPGEWKDSLSKYTGAEVFLYCNRRNLFASVAQAFDAASITFYTVKGLSVAKLYPIPEFRTMGDCDVVVHSEDKEKAHRIFEELGFRVHGKEDMEWAYWKNGIEFELHDQLLYDELVNDKNGIAFSKTAWTHAKLLQGAQYELDWSYHLVFLLLHLRKHIISSGVGFRQFMDMAVVMRSCELDWDWIGAKLEALGLRDFAEICFMLLNRWFETPLPMACKDMTTELYEEATEKIFANGVFGFNDRRNRSNRELNMITQRSGPRWLVRARNLIGSAIPSYGNMRYVPHYSFLNGRPWLLPVAWIYRLYRAVRYRQWGNGQSMIHGAFISGERLDARKKELEKWGL